MCFCDFWGSITTEIMADLPTAGLGRQVSAQDLDRMGERTRDLLRMFNLAAGFSAADDTLSDKLTKRAFENGPHK